nr:Fibronectin domain containing protein [Haemonchus contortus]
MRLKFQAEFVAVFPVVDWLIVEPDQAGRYLSALDITWNSNVWDLSEYSYVLEIRLNDTEENDWKRMLITGKCCHAKYYHTGQSRTAKLRLAVLTLDEGEEERVTEYTESAEFFLPKFHKSSIDLTAPYEELQLLHVAWKIPCGQMSSKYVLKYRLINSDEWSYSEELSENTLHSTIPRKTPDEYIIQLFAYDEDDELDHHTEPLFYKFKTDLSSLEENLLVLKAVGPKTVEVDVAFEESIRSDPKEFHFYYGPHYLPASEKITFDSTEKQLPIRVELLEYFELYLFQLTMEVLGNNSKVVWTNPAAFFTGEFIPTKVEQLKAELLTSKLERPTVELSSEYAAVRVKWEPPKRKNGLLKEYRIRWKTSDSQHSLFAVEKCGQFYDMILYSPNTSYEIFVSAKTSKGYGREERVNFITGSPPDWVHRVAEMTETSMTEITTTKQQTTASTPKTTPPLIRRNFVAKRRKDIGVEYGSLSHARIYTVISTFLLFVITIYYMKKIYTYLQRTRERGATGKATQQKPDSKRRKKAPTNGSQESK